MNSNNSVFGLGTLHFGHFLTYEDSKLLIEKALDLGVNYIDTSPIYGNGMSESFVGRSIKGMREKVILSTKFGLAATVDKHGNFGVSEEKQTERNIIYNLEKSLTNLSTEYIDNYVIHAYDRSTPIEVVLGILDRMALEGKIKSIGCSNFKPEQLREIVCKAEQFKNITLKNAQCHYNLIERKVEKEFIKELNPDMRLVVNRALGRGILSGKYNNSSDLPAGSRASTSKRIRSLLNSDLLRLVSELKEYAVDIGLSLSQMSILWILNRVGHPRILLGVRDVASLVENVSCANKKLTSDDCLYIDELIHKHGYGEKIYDSPPEYFEK